MLHITTPRVNGHMNIADVIAHAIWFVSEIANRGNREFYFTYPPTEQATIDHRHKTI